MWRHRSIPATRYQGVTCGRAGRAYDTPATLATSTRPNASHSWLANHTCDNNEPVCVAFVSRLPRLRRLQGRNRRIRGSLTTNATRVLPANSTRCTTWNPIQGEHLCKALFLNHLSVREPQNARTRSNSRLPAPLVPHNVNRIASLCHLRQNVLVASIQLSYHNVAFPQVPIEVSEILFFRYRTGQTSSPAVGESKNLAGS